MMFSAVPVYRVLDIAAECLGYSNLKEEQSNLFKRLFLKRELHLFEL